VDALDRESSAEAVVAYHERTKHHFQRFAASLGYLDWATQPDPFRRYAGTELVRLPLPGPRRHIRYWQLYAEGAIAPEPLSLASLSAFFRYSLSLTAWKRAGSSTWSLRANPSSGNLHPTEGYAVVPALEALGDAPAVYHYAPREHALERRAVMSDEVWQGLAVNLPEHSFLAGLSSVLWREAWKYGERAFRYCQHDVGHALAALRLAAATLGWRLLLLDGVEDEVVASILGLDRAVDFEGAEEEEPDLLALVVTAPVSPLAGGPARLGRWPRSGDGVRWFGRANILSREHGVSWPVIDEVARATRRASIRLAATEFSGLPRLGDLFTAPVHESRLSADEAILGRRSALAMDGQMSMAFSTFCLMLARLMPTEGQQAVPWDALPWYPRIHLGLFVHRVDGLTPGLYALVRHPSALPSLRGIMRPAFRWERVSGAPPGLPLYLLIEGDLRRLAARVSCGQDIAGDGAFSLGMIADYMDSLHAYGAAFYRNLFWEAGMVGQVLYLEAEEAGIRSTGIGCYFDDPVHDVFGIDTREWQSFYHFTVGAPLEDTRLTTLPAYR